jgi:hypothetical protein
MKQESGCRFIYIFWGVTMLLYSASFAWAEDSSLTWENIPHKVSRGQSISGIAAKAHLTPTALMVFNGLKESTLKQNMTLHFPEIKQVVTSPGKTGDNILNYCVKAYQIYSANAKCYTMVYAVAKTARRDKQFLAIFAFKENAWVEMDRIEFVHPIRWSLTQQISLLSPDAAGNEGCSFYLEFIWSSKDSGFDEVVHLPAMSQYLHGTRMMKHIVSDGAQFTENLPPFNIDSEDIGHPWPERLLFLKTNIAKKQYRLMEMEGDHDR